MMKSVTLIATAKFGLEMLVKQEVLALGFTDLTVSNGRVQFPATVADIPRANLWLRCADRVLLKMAEFEATSFEALFEQTRALPWEAWIPADGAFAVNAQTVKAQLQSNRSCQAIVKKGVADRLMAHYAVDWLPETGASFPIQVTIHKDTAVLTLDTSGVGLHKRGYRAQAGAAPLKETLAAALVQLSFWNKERLLVDPMCGSGTILIEAALIARNMAPGLGRRFAAEGWPAIPAAVWEEARQAARGAIDQAGELSIYGYDSEAATVQIARQNAARAGVGDDITFDVKDVRDLWIDRQYGILITNPPYGLRLSDFQQMNDIYRALHKTFRKKKGWSVYVLTADAKFPHYFKRAKPDRVRKLYNGNIQVNYYQYYGDKPAVD